MACRRGNIYSYCASVAREQCIQAFSQLAYACVQSLRMVMKTFTQLYSPFLHGVYMPVHGHNILQTQHTQEHIHYEDCTCAWPFFFFLLQKKIHSSWWYFKCMTTCHHLIFCRRKSVHTCHSTVGQNVQPWRCQLHSLARDTLFSSVGSCRCRRPCRTWEQQAWPSFSCVWSSLVSCNFSSYASCLHLWGVAQDGGSTPFGCCSQTVYGHLLTASRRKSDAVDQEEYLD